MGFWGFGVLGFCRSIYRAKMIIKFHNFHHKHQNHSKRHLTTITNKRFQKCYATSSFLSPIGLATFPEPILIILTSVITSALPDSFLSPLYTRFPRFVPLPTLHLISQIRSSLHFTPDLTAISRFSRLPLPHPPLLTSILTLIRQPFD